MSFENGSRTTITGPSGGGKSTYLKLLASLLTPSSGKILFENQNIAELTPEKYRMQVSYCFQQPTLFGQTVRDNFLFPYEIRKQPFDEGHALTLLEEVKLPEQYLDKRITELSGGEKQRIALIRNVLFLPKILLLDEVTAGLDEDSKQIVNQWLLELNQKQQVTLIRVTHDSTELAQATRVRKIIAGRLEEAE
ncbi:ATP-binding cassette domain-containing protein [Erwinia sp. CPCC 100877]|nr:ATP-binding cassette domain-containing protein [Erwinia sp. CPCC 100877]